MAFRLEEIQESIIEHLEGLSSFGWHEQAIPDTQTVRRVNNRIVPYFAYQFGDLFGEGAKNMGSVQGDDYVLPIYVQSVAPDPKTVRKMGNLVNAGMIGASFDWAGSVRKRPGGAIFPITASNGATEAYQFACSFGLLVQIADDK